MLINFLGAIANGQCNVIDFHRHFKVLKIKILCDLLGSLRFATSCFFLRLHLYMYCFSILFTNFTPK